MVKSTTKIRERNDGRIRDGPNFYSAPCDRVCLSVNVHILGTSPNFHWMLPEAIPRSTSAPLTSGGAVVYYVLLVLWMTLCFRAIGPMVA